MLESSGIITGRTHRGGLEELNAEAEPRRTSVMVWKTNPQAVSGVLVKAVDNWTVLEKTHILHSLLVLCARPTVMSGRCPRGRSKIQQTGERNQESGKCFQNLMILGNYGRVHDTGKSIKTRSTSNIIYFMTAAAVAITEKINMGIVIMIVL